jgi:hypothetical protein
MKRFPPTTYIARYTFILSYLLQLCIQSTNDIVYPFEITEDKNQNSNPRKTEDREREREREKERGR